MGVIGFGRIGKATADIARAFGMRVIANDTGKTKSISDWVKMVNQDTIFRESDVVSFALPTYII